MRYIKNFLKYINNGDVEGDFTNKIDNKQKELKDRGLNEDSFLEKINNIKKLIKKMHISESEAMDLLDVSESDREKYSAVLINS